jgi:glycosyltransferase involved in cell wall biosynthesis
MPTISAVILTKNEARNIADCLASVHWADEVLVLDSFSTDDTVAIAQAQGARLAQRAFQDWANQRNAALDLAVGEWVFFVDADERATPELAAEIRGVSAQDSPVGWWVPRRNYIFGRWIRHAGWSPDYQLRLLRRGRARYDPTRPVHELVLLDGEDGHLQNPLLHYNYDRLSQFIAKQNRYTSLEARELQAKSIRARPWSPILQPWREFWRRYVTLEGYKDGGHGLLLSLLMAYYSGVTYVKLWRLGK